MVDNVHYCTLKQIMDRVGDPPEVVARKERNETIKEKARKIIIREEKAKYKEKYKTIVA